MWHSSLWYSSGQILSWHSVAKKEVSVHPAALSNMHSITAHLVENVLPKLPLRQWVLSVPKWIRYFIARESKLLSKVLRIFVNEIEKQLKKSSAGIESEARLGAVSFIQRFGSRLNLHCHFHCIVFDGVFAEDSKEVLRFEEVSNFGTEEVEQVGAGVRKRVLSLFKRRGLLSDDDFDNIKSWKGSGGFSVNADVRIDAEDQRGKERLIRYCARPAFSGEKLTVHSGKGESADGLKLQYDVNKNSEKADPPMILTATELFDSLAKLAGRWELQLACD